MLLLPLVALAAFTSVTANEVFYFSVDLYASDTGYYTVNGSEYGGEPSPTLQMEIGKTYTFYQYHETNWMHPLGFAYYPDGAHDDKREVEHSGLVYRKNGATLSSTATDGRYVTPASELEQMRN